jgi:Zn-dependent peptidase ImmA (M78 family)
MGARPREVPYRSYEDLRTVAADFLKEHHPVGSIPVPIEEIVEFQFRLDIIPIEGMFHGEDVYAFVSRDMTSISIDSYIQERVPSSYCFSLAHELAHLLVHSDIISQYDFDTLAEWKAVVTGIDEKVFAEFEWQARALAGLMLVPQEALAAEFGKAAAKIRAAGMSLEKAKEAGRFSVEDYLARVFTVPRFVITDRTERDGLWT